MSNKNGEDYDEVGPNAPLLDYLGRILLFVFGAAVGSVFAVGVKVLGLVWSQ